jgi:hypothetical protein
MSKFSRLFFGNRTNKTVTGTAYMWGLLIANHVDQLWTTNQNYWAAVRSNLLHSFLELHNFVVPFTSHSKLHEFDAKDQFPKLNRHIFWIKNFWNQISAYIRAIWPLVLVSYCFCILPHIPHHCKSERQKIYIPQWMLTTIEVRIVYKTQQKKEPQLGFSIIKWERKKWKEVMGSLKVKVISRKPTTYASTQWWLMLEFIDVGVYDKYYSIDLESHLARMESQSFWTILPNWNTTKYARNKPP